MGRILIVDDSSFQRKRLRGILEAMGHKVLESGDGRSAIEMVSREPVDGIVLDLLMPEFDGIQTMKELHETGLRAAIIVLTANIQISVREQCMALGAFAVLEKPVKPAELLDTLERALQTARGAPQ